MEKKATDFGFTIRLYLFLAGVIYWGGVLSGYWWNHGPYTNSMPDTFMHPLVGAGSLCVVAEWYFKRRGKRLPE